MRKQNGITLIALVITIIIMLILAGVSISAIVGEDGILTKSREAVIKNKIATYKEIIALETSSARMELIDDTEEFLNTVGEGCLTHTEFKDSEYVVKNSSRLVLTTADEYVFVVYGDTGDVSYLGLKDELTSDLPTELVTADIQILKNTSRWTKNPVTVTIKCDEKYATFSIEYSYDAVTWNTYKVPIQVTNNTDIYVRLANDVSSSTPCTAGSIGNIDTKKPVISPVEEPNIFEDVTAKTTKDFKVYLDAQDTDVPEDNASGMSEIRWYYKDSNASEFNLYDTDNLHEMNDTIAGSRLSARYEKTFSDLTRASGTFNIYAEIWDVAGNMEKTSTISVDLLGVTGTHIADVTYWTNGIVNLTLPTQENLTTKYLIDEPITESNISTCTTYNTPLPIAENCSVYYYITDNVNILKTGTATIENIDAEEGNKDPIVSSSLSQNGAATSEKISTTITVQDTVSGFSHIDWYYRLASASGDFTRVPMAIDDVNYSEMNTTLDNPGSRDVLTITKDFEGLSQGEDYYFYAKIYDVASNSVVSPLGADTDVTKALKIKTDQIMVNDISLSPSTINMDMGATPATITATVNPSGAKIKDVDWHASPEGVVTVSNGVVTAIGPGTAQVTATSTDGSNKTSNICTVTVTQRVTGVTLDNSSIDLVSGENTTLTATVLPDTASNKNVTWSSSPTGIVSIAGTGATVTITGITVGDTTVTVTTADGNETASCTVSVKDTVYSASNKGTSGATDTTTNYIGYYADIDYDGIVDGIIYADLEHPVTSTKWNNDSDSVYSYAKGTNLKTYKVSSGEYEDSHFGKNKVIVPDASTTGTNDRFYVMQLSNYTSGSKTTFTWYKNAYGSATDVLGSIAGGTNDFGNGKENTRTIINSTAKTKDDGDIFKVMTADFANGWFVPSKSEWSAFGDAFKITTGNYSSKYGLSNTYWSSSVRDTDGAWFCRFDYGYIGSNGVNSTRCVRLSATF